MTNIQTMEEAVKARLHRCAEEVTQQFRASVRPIYATADGNTTELIGSCILLEIDGARFIATAAHVLDWIPKYALHIVGSVGSDPVQILGRIVTTALPSGGRRKDKLDIGFWRIPELQVSRLGNVSFINSGHISDNHTLCEDHLYMALGCPLSRNRGGVNNNNRTIRVTLRRYTSTISSMPRLAAELGVSGSDHLFLHYGKYAFDLEGNKTNAMNPRGVSGGALVDLGNISAMSSLLPQTTFVGRLAGMLIERNTRHGALIGVKIQKVIDAIRVNSAP